MSRIEIPSLLVIPASTHPDRADRVLSEIISPALSRASVARLIREGRVLLRGRQVRPSTILKPGDTLEIAAQSASDSVDAQGDLPQFSILFEDEDLVVVDKPPGLVVHPGAGRTTGTLMDALVATRPDMIGVGEPGRWGIVHRLDRDTSGVMVAAKSAAAHTELSALFKEHSIHRVYLALVRGDPRSGEGTVDAPLGRHPRDRKRISTVTSKPRAAVTRWKVRERYGGITLLEVMPETGRTHQIRVHLAFAGLPVVGDPVYGRGRKEITGLDPVPARAARLMKRQALHAAVLGFPHPRNSAYVEFSAPPPADMAEAIAVCQRWKKI